MEKLPVCGFCEYYEKPLVPYDIREVNRGKVTNKELNCTVWLFSGARVSFRQTKRQKDIERQGDKQ